MKTKENLLLVALVSILIVFISSCKKEIGQPRYKVAELYPKTAFVVQQQEDAIDKDRANSTPTAYATLAKKAIDAVKPQFEKETPEMIEAELAAFNKIHRDHPKRSDVRIYRYSMRVGISQNLYRYNTALGLEILQKHFAYVAKVVNGSPDWGLPGVRNLAEEDNLIHLLDNSGTICNDTALWTWAGQLEYTFGKFAESGKNKPEKERDGFLNTGLFSVDIEITQNDLKSTAGDEIKVTVSVADPNLSLIHI